MEAEKEKSTVMVDEEEILKMSQKIQQNKNEELIFGDNLHKLISGDKSISSEPLVIGKTPL